MKKVSLIISMLTIALLSFNAQDCTDYTETNGTDNFPGLYGSEDVSLNFDGSNQTVELGVYGFFNDWWSPSQADQTFFSVNGSEPIALSTLSDYHTQINTVFITLNTMSLNDEYLSNSSLDWTSGTVKFSGAIENITMTQFESGLLVSCVEILEEIEGCDYQFEGDDPGFPGYIITGTYPFNFSGEDQLISIGYFDYNPWEGEGSQWLDDSYYSVNGSELFDLHTIYNNQPFSIGDVTITIDTTDIPEGYNVPSYMSSGTINFEGEVDLIVTSQVESGIKFVCVGGYENQQDCIDYTIENEHINYPGIFGPDTVVLDYDGSAQTIELGIYGDFNDWDISPYTYAMFNTTISINGGSPVPIYSIIATGEYEMTEVTIALDPTSLNDEYLPDATVSATSGKILITGPIDIVTVSLTNAGLFYSCTEPNAEIGNCEDLTLTNGTPDFPGIYGGSDVTRNYDGSNQSVNLGIYGLFNSWLTGGQQDQTFFSVNGSAPVSLLELSLNVNYTIDDVVINLDATPLDESYFSSSLDWTSGTLNFSGPVETIVMTQFESGLVFDCSLPLANDYSACEDFTIENNDPNSPGIYGAGDYFLSYDGSYQQVDLAIYGLFNYWNSSLGQADATLFSINGETPISLETIFNNVPYEVNGVSIDLNTAFLGGEFPIGGTFTSGILMLEGNIESVVMTFFESGILASCPETYNVIMDCDYVFEGDGIEIQGFISSDSYSLPFDGTNQQVTMGYFDYATWEQMGEEWPEDQTYFSVNGSALVSIDSIMNNQPFLLNDVLIELDTTSINTDYDLPLEFTSGTLTFTGEINDITTQQVESGIAFICTEALDGDEDCQDFTMDGNDPEFPGLYGNFDATIPFDGSNQMVSMGIYGSWLDWIPGGAQNATFFTINDGTPISLGYIYDNFPLEHEGVIIDLDLTSITDEYLSEAVYNWTTATIIFSGEIDMIIMSQSESGMVFSCTEPIEEQEDCIDYTEENDDPNAPGIYLVDGDFTMEFDSTHQEVSLGIYGGFLDWIDMSNLGQADQTLFSVNGSASISLETIYLNLPFEINDIIIDLDTNSLAGEYPLADSWTSGTITFTGHVTEVVMTQFESGLLFLCTNPAEEECDCEECACQIDADFTYVNIGNYYSFVSSGTGTEYEWDFGDGLSSAEENPTHQYATPGGYEVCLTNYNLTDTCSITICKSIMFMAITPEAHIITPNGDGYDDEVKIACNDVTVYNRNGIIVAKLTEQEYWDGTDDMSVVLPMGEYILKCNENEVVQNITIIR